MGQLDKALALARNGYAVFPLQPGKKIPLAGSKGFQDATTSATVVHTMWAATPDANVGIYPWGGDRKFAVYDIEGASKGNDRIRSKKLLGRKLGMTVDIHNTLVVETPSGGWHIWYEVPPDSDAVIRSTVNFVKGCDVRAEGGYVLAPGSIVDGKTYKTVNRLDPLTVSAEVLAMFPQKREREAAKEAAMVTEDLPHNERRAIAFLEATEPAIEGDGGDAWTFATAAKMKDFGISENHAVNLLLMHWNDRCEPPWEELELEIKVKNAYTHGSESGGIDASDPNADFADMLDPADVEKSKNMSINKKEKFSLATIEERAARPAPTWLVKKVIPDTGFGLIVGAYSSYKTFIAIDLACSISSGMKWGGRITKEGRVVIVAGEGGHGMTKRFQAWFKRIGGKPENLRIVEGIPHFGREEEVRELAQVIAEFDPCLIIIDTLSSVTPGADENSGQDMGKLIAGVQHLREVTGAFVIGIHHLGKDASKGARGWSGLTAAADMELRVTNDPEKLEAHVTLAKSRDSEQWNVKEVFRGRRQDLEEDEDGEMIDSLCFRHDASAPAIDNEEVKAVERAKAIEVILANSGIPVDTKTLAKAVLEATVTNCAPAEFANLWSTITTWVGRYGKEHPRGIHLTSVKGIQIRNNKKALIWNLPAGEENFL